MKVQRHLGLASRLHDKKGAGNEMTIHAPLANVIEAQTDRGFEHTVESVRVELLRHGFSILFEVDFSRELDSQIGVSASRCVVLIVWRAFEAYQAQLSDPNGALMVPFNLAVHSNGNGRGTVVSVLRQPTLAPEAPLGIHVLGQVLNREMREILSRLVAHERHDSQGALNHARGAGK